MIPTCAKDSLLFYTTKKVNLAILMKNPSRGLVEIHINRNLPPQSGSNSLEQINSNGNIRSFDARNDLLSRIDALGKLFLGKF